MFYGHSISTKAIQLGTIEQALNLCPIFAMFNRRIQWNLETILALMEALLVK